MVLFHTEDVLREILRFTGPADVTLSRYFRAHPKLGTRERNAVAEGIYAILRNKLMYASFSESGYGPAMRRLALLGLVDAVGAEVLGGLSAEECEWLARIAKIDRTTLPIALQVNLPSWLYEKLVRQEGEAATLQLANALNRPAPLDVRVNALKAKREDVIAALATAPILGEPTPYASLGIRIRKKPALQNLTVFQSGAIEVQDEGSQILAQIVAAKRGEMVADFCAGAGGKTLALGAAMRNTGRLYAFDVSEKRLNKLKPRLARSGLSNVHPIVIAHENDVRIRRLAGKMDRVLVDAPCSGLGTLRRNPDMKWRQTPQTLAELEIKQKVILASAARLVKPGGRLVYATCSLLHEENESIIEQFIAAHENFIVLPMNAVLTEQKIPLEMGDYLKLVPHLHQTDGFFAAVFERKK